MIAVASLSAIAGLAGCGGGGSSSDSTTVASGPATTSPVKAAEAFRGALLDVTDVPGATPAPPARSTDFAACFPGNPVGAMNNPNVVVGRSLGIVQGRVQRSYGSSVIVAGPKQAAAYVATFASAAGSACLVNAIKKAVSAQSATKADPSALTGTVKAAAVGDAGAVLAVKGNLKVNGSASPAAFDLLAFHKGPVVVVLFAVASGGAAVPGQIVGLAQKVAGRLP